MCELVKLRINELICETNKTLYQVRMKAAIPRSTINTIMQGKCKGVSLNTVALLCLGFEITLKHFFDSKIFNLNNLELD